MKPRLEDTADLKTSFIIMQHFIEERWKRTGKPAELGALLGDISFLPDGSPADRASFGDWLAAQRLAASISSRFVSRFLLAVPSRNLHSHSMMQCFIRLGLAGVVCSFLQLATAATQASASPSPMVSGSPGHDANAPIAFDSFIVVLLVRPPKAPEMPKRGTR